MDDEIISRLIDLEKAQGMALLYACEAGSRVWGCEAKDSDYDVRFIYKRPLSWYLSVNERRDVIEPKVDGLLDLSGWDLKKVLFQVQRGNPSLFEWIYSPLTYFGGDSVFRARLKQLAGSYFNPRTAIYHYLHMASGNYRTYLRGDEVILKKYLYVVRPLLCCEWIAKHHAMPPISFVEVFDDATNEPSEEIAALIAAKREGTEMGVGPRIDALNRWIEDRLEHFAKAARTTPKNSAAGDDLNEFFFNEVR